MLKGTLRLSPTTGKYENWGGTTWQTFAYQTDRGAHGQVHALSGSHHTDGLGAD